MSFYCRQADELRRRGKARATYATFLATQYDPRAIMRRAWAIARAGAARFGGTVRAYFAESLRLAWAETRARIATARAMAEDRRAMQGSFFGLTVVGKLALLEAEGVSC